MKTQVEIAGLWERRDKHGNIYFTGPFGSNANLMIFPNTKRTAENHPHYRLVIVPKFAPKPEQTQAETQFPGFEEEAPF